MNTTSDDGPVSGEKRAGDDRRQDGGGSGFAGENRRSASSERRLLRYAILYTTEGDLSTIEDWIEENCRGAWKLVLVDMDDDLVKKSIKVMFEDEDDKERFKEMLSNYSPRIVRRV